MRSFPLLLISILLAACASLQHPDAEPSLRIQYVDLDLETRDGRAELRRRVRVEIETFCRFHSRDAVPQVLTRLDIHYCQVESRNVIAREMPETVRRAYWTAFEEGGPGTL